jgi:hypothetical protein
MSVGSDQPGSGALADGRDVCKPVCRLARHRWSTCTKRAGAFGVMLLYIPVEVYGT